MIEKMNLNLGGRNSEIQGRIWASRRLILLTLKIDVYLVIQHDYMMKWI